MVLYPKNIHAQKYVGIVMFTVVIIILLEFPKIMIYYVESNNLSKGYILHHISMSLKMIERA